MEIIFIMMINCCLKAGVSHTWGSFKQIYIFFLYFSEKPEMGEEKDEKSYNIIKSHISCSSKAHS